MVERRWLEVASFHTATLVTVLVLVIHGRAGLGAALSGVGTGPGVVVFLFLWLITGWSTRAALGSIRRERAASEANARQARPGLVDMFGHAVVWGAMTGVVFLLGLVAAFIAPPLVSGGEGEMAQLVLVLLAYIAIAVVVAGVVGAVIGTIFGVVDLAATGVGARLAGWATDPPD